MIFHYHLLIGEVRTIRNETTYPIHGKYPLNQFFATDVHRPTRTAWSSMQARACFFAALRLCEKKNHLKDPPLTPPSQGRGMNSFEGDACIRCMDTESSIRCSCRVGRVSVGPKEMFDRFLCVLPLRERRRHGIPPCKHANRVSQALLCGGTPHLLYKIHGLFTKIRVKSLIYHLSLNLFCFLVSLYRLVL